VHINAKTRKQEDQKYIALAQSIIDYEPATLMQGLDEDQDDSIGAQDLSQIIPTSSLSFSPGANNSPTPGPRETLKDLRQAKQPKFTEKPAVIQPTRRSSINYNPPYKNPFHGVRPGQQVKSAFETPDKSQRPRTAPEQPTNTVQVPASRASLRRVQSESASFDSLSTHVSDSQPNAQSFVKGSSPSLRCGLAGDQPRVLVRSHSQASLDISSGKLKQRKLEDTREVTATNIPRPPGTKAFLLSDKMDWTSSSPTSSSSHSSSLATTATPSQPVQANIVEEPAHVSPPVIIISSDSSGQTDRGQSKSQASGPEASEPVTSQIPPPSLQRSSQESRRQMYPSVFETHGLKTEIIAPEPPVGEGHFTTHLTKALDDFARDLPFARFFRPVEVTRDVKVLKRGYWDMEVTIVDKGVAEKARSAELAAPTTPSDMQKRFGEKIAVERLAQYEEAKRNGEFDQLGRSAELRAQGLWTEEEVVSFWQNFSSFIEKGKAGWGSRMVGEEVSDDRSGVERKVRIRIFCWGEVLGHMYLAAWVFSDKLAARIPMRWIAGDGSCIVEMAGTRSGRGTLPEWNRKGHPGERGCWGVG
jgi:hypothetical protein